MEYISLSNKLKQELDVQPVNEVFMTLIAGSVLAFTCAPLFNTEFFKTIGAGIGGMLNGIGSAFGAVGKKRKDKDKDKDDDDSRSKKSKSSFSDNDDDDSKSKKSSSNSSSSKTSDTKKDGPNWTVDDETDDGYTMRTGWMAMNAERMEKEISDEKDSEKKKKLQSQYNAFMASAYDEDGKLRGPKEFKKELAKNTGMSEDDLDKNFKLSKSDMEKDMKDLREHIKKNYTKSDGSLDDDKLMDAALKFDDKVKKAKDDFVKDKEEKEKAEAEAAAKEKEDEEKSAKDKQERDTNRQAERDKEEKEKAEAEAAAKEKKDKGADKVDAEYEKAKKELEAETDPEKKKKLQDKVNHLEKQVKRALGDDDRDEEKEFQITHDGKPDAIIRRKAKRGDGVVYCYKSDQKTTISPKEAKRMLKKNGIKESINLVDYLMVMMDPD